MDNIYEKAIATWIVVNSDYPDVDKISNVSFEGEYIQGCPTCGSWPDAVITFSYNKKSYYKNKECKVYVTNKKPGEFIREVCEIIKELESTP